LSIFIIHFSFFNPVPESFLYFIWQFQYFNLTDRAELLTTDGESVQVLYSGYRNAHAGPDFTDARLLIGGVEWVGTVEAHTKTSDWLAHRHQHDRAYDNVILHIVWHDDRPHQRLLRHDGSPLPLLELKPLTDSLLVDRYGALADAPQPIPCASQFRMVKPLRITAMLDKALLQRLERKAGGVKTIFDEANQDWDETAYRLLAIGLGAKVNAGPMEQLARALPLKVLLKHRNTPLQLEAMLFGTAGLLVEDPETPDSYQETLRREYRFLGAKYGLIDRQLPAHIWKWARLRPTGFPTLRLAQLAQLLTQTGSLSALLLQSDTAPALVSALRVTPSVYWKNHYRFGKPASATVAARLGRGTAEGLLINAAVPLLAAYAHHRDRPAYLDRAVTLLEQLPPELNHLTRQWSALGLSVGTAFDSQASIELYNGFCQPKHCLRCQIGAALVRPKV
jgi:hypothetical protein